MKKNINDLREKCIKVIWSCESEIQLESAIKYCKLACRRVSAIDHSKIINFFVVLERVIAITQYRLKIFD